MSEKSHSKHIFIVRHAHASFDGSIDFERQLNAKGLIAAKKTANFIHNMCKEKAITAELCISSAATRTKQTTEIICKINNVHQCKYYQVLYSTVVSTWLEKIIEEPAKNIIIVGHNPTFSQMLNNLCGYELYMKPANCALIKLEIRPDGIIYPASLQEFYHNE
ncbi:MAG: histidine phosphatase family protein [Alcanivoracaceae bacterium]|nr:histidine phosphatase family protein [Alcanivoracaceae bacterium]